MLKVQDLVLKNKKVLVRLDLNVPVQNKMVMDDFRIVQSVATIKYLLEQQAQVIIMSHLGRPQPEEHDAEQPEFSLEVLIPKLTELLGLPVLLYKSLTEVKPAVTHVSLLENVRFNLGETINCPELGRAYARLADVFVLDAFACSHREHASVFGVLNHIKQAAVGFLFQQEMALIESVAADIKAPSVAIVGGAKVSSKLALLTSLSTRVDKIIVGGGIANTFLLARNHFIGASLAESSLIRAAQAIDRQTEVIVPTNVVVSDSDLKLANTKHVDAVTASDMIVDIAAFDAEKCAGIIAAASTIIWNGPLGIYENPLFAGGTRIIANAVMASSANKLIGGGDTVAALNSLNINMDSRHISTAGGAFLSYLDDGFAELKVILNKFK